MSSPPLDPAYSRLKDHLILLTGLAFYADRDKLLTELIGGRLSNLGLRDCSSYVRFLADGEQGGAELETLINQLTIGETYFFRDEAQFSAIREVILPDILNRNRATRELRIWTAGCATGAEPYSLAILLARQLAQRIAGWQVNIYATDLNSSYLSQAAEGRFREWSLRSTSDEVRRDCFSNEGLIWTIDPRYKQWISFHQMNLVENEFPTPDIAGAQFDLILCRNVMIYFAPEVSRRLIGRFHQSLGEGGWLVVGASEYSPENYKAFRTVTAKGARLYQKTAPPSLPADKGGTGIPDSPDLPPPVTPSFEQPVEPPVEQPAESGQPDIEGLRQLANRGDWHSAGEYGRRLLARDRLNPAIHFYRALIFENLGNVTDSERSLRQAIYLDRDFALAHYHLGLALQRDRRIHAAARSFRNVLDVLTGMPDLAAVAEGPGITVAELKELSNMQLEKTAGS